VLLQALADSRYASYTDPLANPNIYWDKSRTGIFVRGVAVNSMEDDAVTRKRPHYSSAAVQGTNPPSLYLTFLTAFGFDQACLLHLAYEVHTFF
jgi:hypothetical protein